MTDYINKIMQNFLKNNQEKMFLFFGFALVFFTGAFSGYFYFQEQDDRSNIIIDDASQSCQDLFNENSVNKHINSNPFAQVKGEQNKADNTILQNKTGMFVASKNSKIYHLSNCQYVKRIKKENKIWFKSVEEAGGKGYSPHSCAE